MIVIADLGIGNVGSIYNMILKLGHKSVIATDSETILKASCIILPGVGHFAAAMDKVEKCGIIETLTYKAMEERVPFLGICLGMQIMTEYGEEGQCPGLGWVKGKTMFFRDHPEFPASLPVPHMGWNRVYSCEENWLSGKLDEQQEFYFVHSYYVKCEQATAVLKAHHGIWFDAAFQVDNLVGVQFHPEKSHNYGLRLFERFFRWSGQADG